MPLPGSCAVLLSALNILEILEQKFDLTKCNTTDYLHLLAEILKPGFAVRAQDMGDPAFVTATADELLLSSNWTSKISSGISGDHAIDPMEYGNLSIPEDKGTTHFCVADSKGNMVSCTETVNLEFGSLFMLGNTGILLIMKWTILL